FPLDSLGFGVYTAPPGWWEESMSLLDPLEGGQGQALSAEIRRGPKSSSDGAISGSFTRLQKSVRNCSISSPSCKPVRACAATSKVIWRASSYKFTSPAPSQLCVC